MKIKIELLNRPGQIIDENWKFEGSFNFEEYPKNKKAWEEKYDHRFSKDNTGLLYRKKVQNKFNEITIFSEDKGILFQDECFTVHEFKTICKLLGV